MKNSIEEIFKLFLSTRPNALAKIRGGKDYPNMFGEVKFYATPFGTLVFAFVQNLPQTETNFYGFHIHESGECDGDFFSSGGHYGGSIHPMHLGDMPPLMNANGNALSIFLDARISIKEIINKSIIIHLDPDDFTSQPAGNSGKRIACGIITKN